MKKLIFLLAISYQLLAISQKAEAQIIITIAGNGTSGYYGDGGQATSAELNGPNAVVINRPGDIFLTDQSNNVVRLISSGGIITNFAGNGIGGYSGDGGPATAAEINQPTVVTIDSSQNLLIADYIGNRIRKVNTSGIITTVAGNGAYGYSGNGGAATLAELAQPTCIVVDDTGNMYIDDANNNVVRKVNTAGIITIFAGNHSGGFSGDGGNARMAELNSPNRIVFDNQWNMYIADAYNNRIRKIVSGIISTVAGNGTPSFSGDGGQATNAELYQPFGVCVDGTGTIYIADTYNNRIRVVNTSGIISTLAGNGTPSFNGDGIPATAAEVNWPTGVTVDFHNNLYIDDHNNNRLREIPNEATGINDVLPASGKIMAYPIPTTGSFTVSGVKPGQTIDLYDYLGQPIEMPCMASLQSDLHLDISNHSNGIYFLQIINKDGSVAATKKIVKIQ